jgi:RimJ/RimL family protein N-acetyltransferase
MSVDDHHMGLPERTAEQAPPCPGGAPEPTSVGKFYLRGEPAGLVLTRFEEDDIARLTAALPDARSHLLWAGPEYAYPLAPDELRETLAKTIGAAPSFSVYKALLAGTGETVGHVQLMDIDYARSTCVLGKVLIFPGYRGRGLGRAMVGSVLGQAFTTLDLRAVTLLVFTFNDAAIGLYRSLGFVRRPPHPAALAFAGESWQAVRMGLTRERWAKAESR